MVVSVVIGAKISSSSVIVQTPECKISFFEGPIIFRIHIVSLNKGEGSVTQASTLTCLLRLLIPEAGRKARGLSISP